MAGITREENELLTRTGPGTPMGRLFRQYWIPAMLAERLPEPDGAPIAIQLLGERLVAFRDTNGRVGLLDEFCPHRRASLVYGRNEECGLRCVYHGWKFDVTGQVLETPAERNPDFGKSIRHVAYPTREAGGIIWTYMGPEAEPPPFPDFLFTKLPAHQVSAFHYNQSCNYLQGLEGDIDISHPSFLHSTINQAPLDERRAAIAFDPRTASLCQRGSIWTANGLALEHGRPEQVPVLGRPLHPALPHHHTQRPDLAPFCLARLGANRRPQSLGLLRPLRSGSARGSGRAQPNCQGLRP